MPPQQRVRADTEDLRPATPGNQPGQRSQPHPVGGFVPHSFDLAAQHGVLMTKNQQFDVFGHVAAHEHRGDFEHEPRDHVSQRQRRHPARLPGPAMLRSKTRRSAPRPYIRAGQGLVGKPPVTGSVAARPGRLDELGGEPLDPPVDSDVIDGDSTLGQQLPGVPVGQSIAQVPADGDRDHLGGNRKPAKTEAMPGAVTGPVSRLPRISRCNSAGVGSRPPTVPRREMLAQPNVELTRPVQHWQTSSAHVTWFSAPTRARWLARRWCYRPRGWHRRRWWPVGAGGQLTCRVGVADWHMPRVASVAWGQQRVRPRGSAVAVLRTPDERFQGLQDYEFEPHYVTIVDERLGPLRMHY